MLGDIKLLTMATAMARHAAERHRVLSENIANADTNGYKAKDLEPFAEAYGRAIDASETGEDIDWRVVYSSRPGAMSPNGNTVSLEDQMMRTVEAQQSHEAATAIYKKAMEILRLTLGKNA
ncbi:MAG: FlgB family protein [Amphiplicatus sp.]